VPQMPKTWKDIKTSMQVDSIIERFYVFICAIPNAMSWLLGGMWEMVRQI